jgi:hypothetical protein
VKPLTSRLTQGENLKRLIYISKVYEKKTPEAIKLLECTVQIVFPLNTPLASKWKMKVESWLRLCPLACLVTNMSRLHAHAYYFTPGMHRCYTKINSKREFSAV